MNYEILPYESLTEHKLATANMALGHALAKPEGDFANFMNGRETQFQFVRPDILAERAANFYTNTLKPVGFGATLAYRLGEVNVIGFNGFADHDGDGSQSRHVFRVQALLEGKGVGTALMRYELEQAALRQESELYCGKADVALRHPALGRIFEKLTLDESVPATYVGNGKFDVHLD